MAVVFGLLLVVFLAEVGYLVFTNYFAPNNQVQNNGKLQVVTPEPDKDADLPEKEALKDAQAIDQEVIDNLTRINGDILTTSELKNHYYGVIVDVEFKDGLLLKIKGSKHTNSLKYSSKELALIEVQKSVGSNRVKATIEEIQPGQNVFIEEDLDLLQDLTNMLVATRIIIVPSSESIPSQ